MDNGFWAKLNKPIFAMAPMANVTDAAFRRMFAEVAGDIGKPSIFWTEFVSVEGLLSAGRERLLVDFWKSDLERPIVAQVFGSKPEQFEEVARLIRELGFDGIDINMGCPDRGIEKSGAGASLIRRPELAREIIRATKRGATSEVIGANGKKLPAIPVSVKTRIGYAKNEIAEWLPILLEENIAALTIHLRTRNEMSDVPAHWEIAPEIVVLRNRIAPKTLLLGNGDVATLAEAHTRTQESGFDGVMIGRGMFGNPWCFSEASGGQAPSVHEKLMKMVEHTELFEKLYLGDKRLKSFDIMKKHFKAYCSGFDDAKELRIKLMEAENAAEVRKLTESFLSGFSGKI